MLCLVPNRDPDEGGARRPPTEGGLGGSGGGTGFGQNDEEGPDLPRVGVR